MIHITYQYHNYSGFPKVIMAQRRKHLVQFFVPYVWHDLIVQIQKFHHIGLLLTKFMNCIASESTSIFLIQQDIWPSNRITLSIQTCQRVHNMCTYLTMRGEPPLPTCNQVKHNLVLIKYIVILWALPTPQTILVGSA